MTKPVVQKHLMGCAVACVASLLNISYERAVALFSRPSQAGNKGFYCREVCQALEKKYAFCQITKNTEQKLKQQGIIVFVSKSKKYPQGHYLLKTAKGWMNPWINFPEINPAKAGFQKKLPSKAKWVIFRQN